MKSRLTRIVSLTIVGLISVAAYIALEKKVFMKTKESDALVDMNNIIETPLQIGGSFKLTNHLGEEMTQDDFKGQIVLMFFGYTYCPDYCPMELQSLSEVLYALDKAGLAQKVQPIFVSIDPERDSPEVLKSFLKPFHQQIIALTGDEKSVADMKEKFRVYGAKVAQESGYLMDHSTFLYVLDEHGQFKSMIRYEASSDEILSYVKSLLKS